MMLSTSPFTTFVWLDPSFDLSCLSCEAGDGVEYGRLWYVRLTKASRVTVMSTAPKVLREVSIFDFAAWTQVRVDKPSAAGLQGCRHGQLLYM
jgi:hypothetical protein